MKVNALGVSVPITHNKKLCELPRTETKPLCLLYLHRISLFLNTLQEKIIEEVGADGLTAGRCSSHGTGDCAGFEKPDACWEACTSLDSTKLYRELTGLKLR